MIVRSRWCVSMVSVRRWRLLCSLFDSAAFFVVSITIIQMKKRTIIYLALAVVAGYGNLLAEQYSASQSAGPKLRESNVASATIPSYSGPFLSAGQHSKFVAKGKGRRSSEAVAVNRNKGGGRFRKERNVPLTNGGSANPKVRLYLGS